MAGSIPNGASRAAKAQELLEAAESALKATTEWTPQAIRDALEEVVERSLLGRRDGFAVIRLALTGRSISPPLFELVAELGRDRAVGLIRTARHR